MVVGRDYLFVAAALLEAAQLTGKSEAQELTLRTLDLIALVDELSAPDDSNATAH